MSSHANVDASGHDHHEPHVLPLNIYFGVFGALIFLTLMTVIVSFLGLPSTLSIVVALIVALIKSGFVVGYFMHLKYDVPFNRIIFFGSFIFMILFFVLTMADLGTRDQVDRIEGTFVKKDEVKMQKHEQKQLDLIKKATKKAKTPKK